MPETRATTAGPDRFEQHLVAGSELLRRDQVAEARAELEAALELRPTDLKALGLFGLACFRQNAFDDALPVYQRMVELRPDDASHRLNLGLVYLKVGQAERAVHELGRSRALDPSQQRTVSYLGLAHARRGDYGDAYEAFLRAGQEQLALEMAQYLSREEAEAIRARVAAGAGRAGRQTDVGVDSDVHETVERRPPAVIVPDEDEEEEDDGDAL
ncbi:MAG TPA: tetratricopeptide repeat protein, partial [Candidatus Acidoferrum sp.]|nr:tetratricopeptide repeat protein [Candidatus Acidoferrum sp.]